MRPQRNAGGAPTTPPASHDEPLRESIDLPPAMAALGGDFIAELASIRSTSLPQALEQLSAAARATAHRGRAWRLFRLSYEAQANRLRADRLRGSFARGTKSSTFATEARR